jgi:hypothetical protein
MAITFAAIVITVVLGGLIYWGLKRRERRSDGLGPGR